MLRKIFISVFSLLLCTGLYAQNATLEVSAPPLVGVGENFRVEYSITQVTPENFIQPEFTDFEVIAGPTQSFGSSTFISGNNIAQTSINTYVYVLQARTEGKFTIPSASVTAEGKTYTSRTVPIEVVAAGAATRQEQRPQQGGQQQAATVGDNDVLIRTVVDKTNVFKGQPVRVAFKLYTRVPLSMLENVRFPSFNGFWAQELNTDNYTDQRETYNNNIYDTRVIREYLLYPQQAGTLQIEPYDLTATAQIITMRRPATIFDDLFGGGPDVEEIRKNISSQAVTITVNDLPGDVPAGFSGAVGNFTMEAELSEGSIGANSSATYKIKVSGTGNLPLIQAPNVDMPSSFEQLNVKTTENLNRNVNGISGSKEFEYPFIARGEGNYTIPTAIFSYFNPETARYVTLSTRELDVTILPDSTGGRNISGGLVSGLTKEDLKILGRDIRFIKIGTPALSAKGNVFLGGTYYFLILLLLVVIFVCLLLYLQKRIKQMQNADIVRGKRANKVALSRLKAAEEYMKNGNMRRFYDEMLKALWGYMSDKLNIPVANLTKENVREELLKRNIQAEQINIYIDIISECEYAQYSPAESAQMQDVYRGAIEAITRFESYIKRQA